MKSRQMTQMEPKRGTLPSTEQDRSSSCCLYKVSFPLPASTLDSFLFGPSLLVVVLCLPRSFLRP